MSIASRLVSLPLVPLLACAVPNPVVEGILASETSAGPLRLRAAWGLQPFTNAPLPGYLRIVNTGVTADTLLDASSDVAARSTLHGTPGGGAAMLLVTEVVVAPGDSVMMVPGGVHLMFEDLRQPVVAGDTVVVVLRFARAGEVVLPLPVVGYDKLEALQ